MGTGNWAQGTGRGSTYLGLSYVPKRKYSVLTVTVGITPKKHSVTASSVSYNIEDETITLEFPRALHVGSSWILDITYIGLVNDKLNGFYRSAYTDANNNIQ